MLLPTLFLDLYVDRDRDHRSRWFRDQFLGVQLSILRLEAGFRSANARDSMLEHTSNCSIVDQMLCAWGLARLPNIRSPVLTACVL